MRAIRQRVQGLGISTLMAGCLLVAHGEEAPPPASRVAIVINIPSRTLALVSPTGETLARYPVGVGRPGYPTPTGNFRVIRQVRHPGWEQPMGGKARIAPRAQGNPLGTTWLGFHPHRGGEYGIHGTHRPQSVGQLSSHGCVRMRIADAEALFWRVQEGTPVVIRYERLQVQQDGPKVTLRRYPDVYHRRKPSLLAEAQAILRRDAPDFDVSAAELARQIKALERLPVGKSVVLNETPTPNAEVASP